MAKDRLYYDDARLLEFDAKVVSCEGPEKDEAGRDLWMVKLSPNAFYPESGGQPSDRGTVDGKPVMDIAEDDAGDVVVMLGEQVSGDVHCVIDGARRFDLMQQHTGQHILSAAFERLFGFETVGFHLGEEYCTVDLDTERLEEWQAAKAEEESNKVVFSDVPVLARFVDNEKLASFNLRKMPKVDTDIRIVTVEGFDNCPCGGTHVSHTGEIGLIKITRIDRAKGKVRLELLCGGRALRDYSRKNRQLLKAASSLSVHPADLESQIERMLGQVKDLKKALADTSARLMEYDAAKLWQDAVPEGGVKVIIYNAGAGSMDTAKQFALKLVSNPGTLAAVGASGSDNAYLVVARSQDLKVDASAAFKAAVAVIGGKGGGNPALAQGGGSDVSKLDQALQAAREHLRTQLV